MADPHNPYAALRLPDYRRLLACGVLGSIASAMQSVAVGWELYQRTNSKAALGYVGLVQFLPILLLSLPAGHAADRFDRKWLLACALTLSALASMGLAALSFCEGPVPLIYLCLGLIGVGQAFSGPARWALMPSIVPDELLASAVTWTSMSWQIASVVGPALGGLVLWASSDEAANAYLLAVLFSLSSAAFLIRIRPRPLERRSEKVTLDSLLAGLRFVFTNDLILATITLDLFAVLLGGAIALLPVFTRDILHVGPAWLGWLRAAPSLGALLMALFLAHRPPIRRAGPALLWSVAGFGAATIVFGFSRNPWLSLAMMAATGAVDNISVVVRATLVQVLTPDAMRGRVASVVNIFIGSSNELGEFESGLTAAWFGPVASVVGGGIGSVLVVLAVMLRWPRVMRLGSLANLAEEQGVVVTTNELAEAIGTEFAALVPDPRQPAEKPELP
jgi:MFS family permease